jgi:hypothetical protein
MQTDQYQPSDRPLSDSLRCECGGTMYVRQISYSARERAVTYFCTACSTRATQSSQDLQG